MRRTHTAIIVLLTLLAIAIWWLSREVVWLGDDLDYIYRMHGAIWESWGRIRTVGEFFTSQWVHYLHVNGRYVAHLLVQLFNGVLGQEAFAVVNSLVYPATAIVLARLGGARRLTFLPLLTAIILLLAGFMTKMMPTCQIGYIWGLGVNLLWIGLFLSGRTRSRSAVVLMCVGGLIAGNWQEAYSVGIGGALGVIVLSQWLRHPVKRLTKPQEWMAIFYIIGTASVCLAPATLSRAVSMSGPTSEIVMVSPPGWLYALLSLRIFYLFVGVLIWSLIRRRVKLGAFFYQEMLWVTAMLLLIVFNLTLGVFGNRQLFGIEMCSAVLTLRLLPHHGFNRFWTAVGCVAIVALYAWQYTLAMDVKRQFEDIEKAYTESPDGRVFYDRRRATNEGFTREIRIYEDIVGLYDNDPHHSLMKFLRHQHPKQRPLLVVPTGVRTLGADQSAYRDTIWSYAPGHYVIVGQVGDTVTIRSIGEAPLSTLGMIPDVERHYDFHKALKGPGNWRYLVVTPTDPWRTPNL